MGPGNSAASVMFLAMTKESPLQVPKLYGYGLWIRESPSPKHQPHKILS